MKLFVFDGEERSYMLMMYERGKISTNEYKRYIALGNWWLGVDKKYGVYDDGSDHGRLIKNYEEWSQAICGNL